MNRKDTRKHGIVWAVLLILIMVFVVAACGNQGGSDPSTGAQNFTVSMRGGPESGFYSIVGEGVANVWRQSYPDATISYELGSPAGNVTSVVTGEAMLGLTSSIEIHAALSGIEPYPEAYPEGSFYAIGKLFDNNVMHAFIRRDFAEEYGIESFQDIADQQVPVRISINRRGNVQNQETAKAILNAYGITLEKIEAWGGQIFYENSGGSIDLLRDRKMDLFITAFFSPDSRFEDLNNSVELGLLPIGEEVVAAVAEEFNLQTFTMPAGDYSFLDEEYPTFGIDGVIIASPELDDAVAAQLTRAFAENAGDVQQIHSAMGGFGPEMWASVTNIPYHPGSEQVLTEAGYLE